MYAILAQKHIATLRRVRPGITTEARWRPAHEGVPCSEKGDERAELAAESGQETSLLLSAGGAGIGHRRENVLKTSLRWEPQPKILW